MGKLIIYCGLDGVEAIRNPKSKKIVFIGNPKKSKLKKLKTYPKAQS
jgi:hypothetical protein